MHERLDAGAVTDRLEAADESRGMRAHHSEQRLDRMQHGRDAAERERRRAKAHHLAVGRRSVSPHDVDGIGGGVDVVERLVQ
jgi:hypothetical protein